MISTERNNSFGRLLKAGGPGRRRKTKPSASIPESTSSSNEETVSLEQEQSNTNGHTAEGLVDDGVEEEAEVTRGRKSSISTSSPQIGFLTTSHPVVQAAHLQESQQSETQSSDQSRRAATFHAGDPDGLSPSPSLSSTKTGLAPPPTQARRSPSPVGRLREAFRPKKSSASHKSSTSTSGSNPDQAPHPPELDTASQSSKSAPSLANSEVDDAPPKNASPVKKGSSSRLRRPSLGPKLDTSSERPQTPSSGEKPAPVIVNTPPTPTESSPRPFQSESPSEPPSKPSPEINEPVQLHLRRGRASSGSLRPSKLSNITTAPLTPAVEEPQPTPSQPGFFSSMISAVQNTANTFSNTASSPNPARGGASKFPAPHDEEDESQQDNVQVEPSAAATQRQSMESKEPAVKTLGAGDLSLSQLGIIEPSAPSHTPTTPRFSDVAGSRGRSDSAPADPNQATSTSVDTLPEEPPGLIRPRTSYEGASDRTPPPASLYGDKGSLPRSDSFRSRRKRGSSAATHATNTTGMTIGAAIAAANASITHPTAAGAAPKLTGFAVASKKRNRDFHSLFKSVPDDDYLIEDYSCALQREILAHGRLYVSEGHLCFSSNIFGWVTTLVMSFDEIVAVEKRSTALLFKNGLEISTLHAKHVFASFTSRDSTYDLIVKIWRLGHPSLQSSLNGVRLQETGGDKTEKVDAVSLADSQIVSGSDEDESDAGDDVYDEDEENDDHPEDAQPAEASATLEPPAEKAVARKPSGGVTANGAAEKEGDGTTPGTGVDFPGPTSHAPTDCGDVASHYDKIIGDDTIPAPLGKVYNLLFGPESSAWMGKWLANDQKCTEVQMGDNKKGLGDESKSRTFSYIKPLNASLGPKQTKCIVTEQLESMDLEKSVNVTVTTQTPDVPSGNIFSVKTKYCLSWAENNATRIQGNCTIEWTGKSWLRGPIDKGANEGQMQYCKDLFASLKSAVISRSKAGAPKSKKRGRRGKTAQASSPASDVEEVISKTATKQDWGLLEPARPLLGPVVDTIKPILTGNVVYGLLVGLLVAAWFGFGSNAKAPRHELGYMGYPDRLVAYEEMWGREEGELWEWLEERVGFNQLNAGALHAEKRTADPRAVEERVREEKMSEREIKEAIKVTEEKLNVLKSVVEKEGKSQRPSNEKKHQSSRSGSSGSTQA